MRKLIKLIAFFQTFDICVMPLSKFRRAELS